MNKRTSRVLLGLAALIVIGAGLVFLTPFYKEHLAWRIDDLRTSIYYYFNPPDKVSFLPTQSTLAATPDIPTLPPTSTPVPTDLATPTITPTALPSAVTLQGVTFVDQMHRWNYCGPANLSMALEYWGWKGEPGNTMDIRDQIASVVKPGQNDPNGSFIDNGNTDVNVMPYELVDYVNDHTSLRALYRFGGDLDLVKRLIAAGFPVIAEKGIYQTLPPENTMQWAGHYAFTTGYDDSSQEYIWQDSYTPNDKIPYKQQGYNQKISYAEYQSTWRAFDYIFIVVYPPDRENDLFKVLGPWADEGWAFQHALDIANQEIPTLTGQDLFFAWFNRGTSLVYLGQDGDAATAFDYALGPLFESLSSDQAKRPYRIMWYQTTPYKAYYNTSQYQKVITLADNTLSTIHAPRSLEESLYWKALSEYALGQYDQAYKDIRQAYFYNRNLQATLQIMQAWGVTP